MTGLRAAAALLTAVVLVPSCAPDKDGSDTAPQFRQQDAVARLKADLERVTDEVAPAARTVGPWEATTCPGGGRTWQASLTTNTETALPQFEPIRNWLSGNGFSVTEQTADDVRTVQGRTADGFTAVLTRRFGDQVDLTFTSPCTARPGAAAIPLAAPRSGLEAPSLQLACEKPQRYVVSPAAPQYRGHAPHPIALFRSFPPNIATVEPFVPQEWDAAPNDQVDKKRVQLVACLTAVPGATVGRVNCSDHSDPLVFPVRETTYQVVVRTALTGQKVATFTLPGTSVGQDTCPRFLEYSDQTVLLRSFTRAALNAQLRPLATGRR
ncbi:hypothetical protein [Streptomyces sp. SID13031]|uniref:hypothetical protein n=1 Tax=Streptomyces sp. SID13031 TaxID=2706046 RepID=UPI0013CB020C|nr:hypothetical protein [Streptomyces sp. SID13031]NEA30369.1 hypothetical protein [Streptomyces sp. SID13031]